MMGFVVASGRVGMSLKCLKLSSQCAADEVEARGERVAMGTCPRKFTERVTVPLPSEETG